MAEGFKCPDDVGLVKVAAFAIKWCVDLCHACFTGNELTLREVTDRSDRAAEGCGNSSGICAAEIRRFGERLSGGADAVDSTVAEGGAI